MIHIFTAMIFNAILVFLLLVTASNRTTAAEDAYLQTPSTRRLHFSYETTISNLPADFDDLRIWIPIPTSDENQTISALTIETTPHLDTKLTRDKTWNNQILFAQCRNTSLSPEGTVKVKISFDILRHEAVQGDNSDGLPPAQVLLQGSKFAPITQEVIHRSQQSTNTAKTVRQSARAIYDRVLSDVDYDKSIAGWGHGSISYVCASGKGNCTDFHSLFIAMAQADRIPAYFEIGVSIPANQKEGTLSGYHCWAWYLDSPKLWRPIDASEADKHPVETDYYFGSIDANRIAFSRGRDIILQPHPTSSTPVNFFIYPVVELDNKPLIQGVKTVFHFHDIP